MDTIYIASRPAIPEDISQLAELCGQLGYPVTPQQVAWRLGQIQMDSSNIVYVAALSSGMIIGWVHASARTLLMVDPFVEIEGLVVDKDYRSQQIGKQLLGEVEKWARLHRWKSVYVRSNDIREAAHGFYETNGYKKYKTQHACRFRIEHAQHIHPKDFARFARLGVIASVQPYHAIDDGRWAEGRIGHARCATAYPFRTFLASGATLSFGSDWTVGPLSPLAGI